MTRAQIEQRLSDFLVREIPIGLRLPILFVLVAAAFVLGIAAASWRPAKETARIEAVEERVLGLENQKRQLWKVYEAIRTRRDRLEAFGTEILDFPKLAKPQEPEPQL